jgi:DNA-binding transcriptional regulator LsrR (DeoR family)
MTKKLNQKDQLKEWAYSLFMQDVTQKEIAAKIGVSEVTLSKWAKAGGWDDIRKSRLVTKDVELQNKYEQLSELNAAIKRRPEGERYPNAKEADVQCKLAKAIRELERNTAVWQVVQVQTEFIKYVRTVDPKKAIEVSELVDAFIKNRMQA